MASQFAIQFAAHQVRHGGIILYPTETVYGLGCDPMNLDAINRLNQLKHREPGKGLILLSHTLKLFEDYIEALTPADQKKNKQHYSANQLDCQSQRFSTRLADQRSTHVGDSHHAAPYRHRTMSATGPPHGFDQRKSQRQKNLSQRATSTSIFS